MMARPTFTGNPYLWYVKLNEDMISYDEEVGVVEVPLTEEGFGKREGDDPKRPTLYEEAPWFYKRDGLYYMVYAASGIPENIAYSTSPNPTGPWTFGGIIMPTQGSSFTNHPGLCDFKGRSYFFIIMVLYQVAEALHVPFVLKNSTYNEDGSFPELNMTTAGVEPVANLNPYQRNEAETIAWSYGIKTEPCTQGGMNVCNIDDGDYIRVSSVDFGKKGAVSFSASIASVMGDACIELRLGSPDGELVGTLEVPNTGGYADWELISTDVSGVTGVQELFFVFKGRGSMISLNLITGSLKKHYKDSGGVYNVRNKCNKSGYLG